MEQSTLKQTFNHAIQHHQAGRFAEAQKLYQNILSQDPNNADATHFLGVIAYQTGRLDEAVSLIGRAVALNPQYADARNSLGNALNDKGRFDEAIAEYRQAISLRPGYTEAHSNLSVALRSSGRLDEAIAAARQAIATNPKFAQAHFNLAMVLKDQGKTDEAEASFHQAIALRPNYAEAQYNLGILLAEHGRLNEAINAYRQAIASNRNSPHAWLNLGNALRDSGQVDEAIAAFEQAIVLRPEYAEAFNNLGSALRIRGRLEEAIAAYRRAIAIQPNAHGIHSNLGNALTHAGRFDEAVAAFRQAIAIHPNYAEGYSNLGKALRDLGDLDQAIVACRQAIALRPDLGQTHSNLGTLLKDQGQIEEAIEEFRQALSLNPNAADAHSNLLFTLHYHSGYSAEAIAQEHRAWDRQHAEPLRKFWMPHGNDPNPNRRLRVGYVSSDFRRHSVAYFFESLLASHERDSVETFCYSNVVPPDAITARLRQHANQWREIVGLNDASVADLIRKDEIDILVDLSGHSGNNRLPIFGRKPAPVQVTYLGYPDTTGIAATDYRLTDAYADPPGRTESFHSEQLVRLPRTFLCYRPSDVAPAVGPPPMSKVGHIVFGSFNAFPKINQPLVQLWARILKSVPNSKLILKNRGLASPTAKQWVMSLFIAERIQPDRIELHREISGEREHLQFYDRIDIALDTFPYHGTTTTCEALWMGVPTVTLAGQTHVSRVGVSILSNIGLTELIADRSDEYVSRAISLAGDMTRLKDLRRDLRERLSTSPLMDAAQFAGDVEAAYRQMWQTWCAARPRAV